MLSKSFALQLLGFRQGGRNVRASPVIDKGELADGQLNVPGCIVPSGP